MDNNYINKLKAILESQSLSQQALAKKMGVSFAALNRWLNGHAIPRPSKLALIERFYRETVQFASFDETHLRLLLKQAVQYRKKKLWTVIEKNQNLQEDLILEHTYNSTTIEGTTFTKKQTEGVIFDKQNIQDKSLVEHLDVVNYSSVLKKIFSRDIDCCITEQTIKDIHTRLMQGVRDDGGMYSKQQRAIRGVDIMLTHPNDIPEEMTCLLKEWHAQKNQDIHAIAKFHADFELIHPFGDGNGRVGRLIMVLQCQAQNYAPVIIENMNKAEYYEVLEYAQRHSEYPLVEFLVREMKKTVDIFKRYE